MIKKLFDLLTRYELLRFCIVGGCAVVIHYGIYWGLWRLGLNYNFSYVIGYAISFGCNFFASNYFTFKTKPTFGRVVKFAASHGINLLTHMLLLNLFIRLGMNEEYAPLPVFAIAIPINFVLVRCSLKGLPECMRRRNEQ